MKIDWNATKTHVVLGGVISALIILPNLGRGLEVLAYVVNTPSIAYAAKSTAEDVDDKFQQYLAKQDAVAEALNKYVGQQQQQQQMPTPMQTLPLPQPSIHRLWDDTERRYYCQTDTQWWWADGNGYCE